MNKSYIVGIDPGFSGAIAALEIDGKDIKLVMLSDMPLIKDTISNPRPRVCGTTVSRILSQMPDPLVVIESVHASPQMGVTSAFRFGEGFGTLGGIFAAHELKVFSVVPAVWKSHFGLDQNKNKSRILAKKFFPSDEEKFKRAKDDGRAESALIALFGYRKFFKPVAEMSHLI